VGSSKFYLLSKKTGLLRLLVELNSLIEKIDNGDFNGNGKFYDSSRGGMRQWVYNRSVVEKLFKVAEVFCGGPELLSQYFVDHKMTEKHIDEIQGANKDRIGGIMQR